MKKLVNRVLSLLIVVALAVILFKNKSVIINASSNNFNINSLQLYSSTNTYNYNTNINDSIRPGIENNRLYIMNSKNDRNGNVVSTEAPLITVLTNGLGGDASHWSNIGADNNLFGYTPDSIITKLFKRGNSNIYIAKVTNNTFELYDITKQYSDALLSNKTDLEEIKFDEKNQISSITDISKHSIVIFQSDGSTTNLENYKVYKEFNYAISRVVYDVKLANNNVLPRINLIGHSRGGITNIEYALDHPDMVASVFSLGTPYCGSTSASIDYKIGCPIGNSPEGEHDIITESIYRDYMERWNSNYEELGYDKINVHALGGYATLEFYRYMAWTDQCKRALQAMWKDIPPELFSTLITVVFSGIEYAVKKSYLDILSSGKALLFRLISTIVSEALANFDLSDIIIDDIIQILVSELNLDYHYPFVSWYNDCLVNLTSQLGLYGGTIITTDGYEGFKREKFCFTPYNSNTDAYAQNNIPVVHNLEPRDKRMLNYILKI